MDIFMVILFAIISAIVLVGGYMFYMATQLKWFVETRDVCGTRRIVDIQKAREVKRDGVTYLKLQRTRDELPYPPEDTIDITRKGRKFVVAYNLGGGNFQYCKDIVKDKDIKDRDKVFFVKDTAVVDKAFQPITTNQRLVLIEQIKKAQARRKKSLWELALPLAGVGACLILVVSLFVFWGDLAKPILEAGGQNVAITEKQAEITKTLQEIIQKKQIIDDTESSPTPPDAGGAL